MDLAAALAYLDEHINLEAIVAGRIDGAHARAHAAAHGACWATRSTRTPSIHLTGTNGKGSTAA